MRPRSAVNGPVPPVLSRFAFPGLSPWALRGARIAFDPTTGAAGALRGEPKRSPRQNEGHRKRRFPAGHDARSRPRGPGLRRGSAGLAVPGDTELGQIPGFAAHREPGAASPGAIPAGPVGARSRPPEPRPSRRAQPGRGGGRGCAGGGGD